MTSCQRLFVLRKYSLMRHLEKSVMALRFHNIAVVDTDAVGHIGVKLFIRSEKVFGALRGKRKK